MVYYTMNIASRPYAAACDENKEPILAVLRRAFAAPGTVLEIGSGTGQHAVYFGAALPHLVWQTSDVPAAHAGIRAWLSEATANVLLPLALDVLDEPWPVARVDHVFSANTAHIMSLRAAQAMFAGVGRVLVTGGVFALYGPFNYGGRYTSESNRRFDQWLKSRDPASGVRDVDDLTNFAQAAGLALCEDVEMPANNRTLLWRKS